MSALGPLSVHGLIKDDPKSYFVSYLEQIYDIWISLVDKTTLRSDESSELVSLGDAFRELDEHIASPDPLKSRLGAVQLTNLMASLKERIKADRRRGRITVKGRCDTFAIDAYGQARGLPHDKFARVEILKQLRMSKRWYDLTRNLPLLSIIFTPEAEKIV